MKAPTKCSKCGSKNIIVKYCPGIKPSTIRYHGTGGYYTSVGNSGGFMCKTADEHFHYYCKHCSYKETGAA